MANVRVPDSKSFSLNGNDLVNLGKNAALVGLAAALAYVGENIASVDLGNMGIMLVPVIAVGLDTLVKWARNNVTE